MDSSMLASDEAVAEAISQYRAVAAAERAERDELARLLHKYGEVIDCIQCVDAGGVQADCAMCKGSGTMLSVQTPLDWTAEETE